MARWAIALTVVLLGAAACSGDEVPRAERSAIWDERDPMVRVEAPDPLLVLDPKAAANATLTALRSPEVERPYPLDRQVSAQTLYGDPELADPLTGPTLLVGRTNLSDTEGGFPLAGESLALDGRVAEIGRHGPMTIVTWPIPLPPGESCGCEHTAVVAGRNLTRAEVVRAARAARPTLDRPHVPADRRPEGLESLGTLPALGLGDRWFRITEVLEVLVGGAMAEVRVLEGDPRLEAHLDFWLSEGRYHYVEDPGAQLHRVVRRGERVVVFDQRSGPPITGRAADEIVATLVEGDTAAVDRAKAEAARWPPDAADPCDPGPTAGPTTATLTGALGDARWSVTIGTRDELVATCASIETGSGPAPIQSVAAGRRAPVAGPSEVRIIGNGSAGDGERHYRIVSGDVPAATARAEVQLGSGGPVEAELADLGPEPGRRWFAAAIEAPLEPEAEVVAVAFSADGEEAARTEA